MNNRDKNNNNNKRTKSKERKTESPFLPTTSGFNRNSTRSERRDNRIYRKNENSDLAEGLDKNHFGENDESFNFNKHETVQSSFTSNKMNGNQSNSRFKRENNEQDSFKREHRYYSNKNELRKRPESKNRQNHSERNNDFNRQNKRHLDSNDSQFNETNHSHIRSWEFKKTYPEVNNSNVNLRESTISIDVEKFWHNLTKRVNNKHKNFELDKEEHNIWLDTWNAAAYGAKGPVEILPIALLRLPATSDLSPSPKIIIKVLIEVANHIRKVSLFLKTKSDVHVVNILEAIFDIVKLRLSCLIQEYCDDLLKLINELENTLTSSITSSLVIYPQYSERLARLILRKNEFEELRKKLKENSRNKQMEVDDLSNQNKYTWLGWQQSPTLDWLMSGSWHDVYGLKAMYESSEEYVESLLKLWTLLTFYWGSGAVWPKCTYKQRASNSELACGEPLLTIASVGECKKCNKKAAWKCFRHGHDHICSICLKRQQEALIGSPGPHSSTDIYDAVIERSVLRRGEAIYLLKNLESRKPPKIAPNWKTSYRLPISVLVAVVRLGVSREPLNRNSLIQWGEIVPYDIKAGSNQDWTYRSKGCMAFRLLNKADCFGMPDETDSFIDSGVCVSIIDLRVFVPEVISVLNTFSKKDFKDQLNQIPFLNRLLGHDHIQMPFNIDKNDSIERTVGYALENSEIDYVQRLNPSAKYKLINDICALNPIKSLSGTQLEAFSNALFSSVHCTQGPPGTGKSYIGVCLVLALDLIRKSAELDGHSVGPILVLSYKNHALDEFLNDIIEQYENSGKNNYNFRNYSSLRPGMLIRTGKPDLDSLERYTERNTDIEIQARLNLERIILIQRKFRSLIKELLESARSLEYNDINSIQQINSIFVIKNVANDKNSYISNVICMALTLYCLMDSYKSDLFDESSEIQAPKKPSLIELNEDEFNSIFKHIAYETGSNLVNDALAREFDLIHDYLLEMIHGLSKDLEYWKIPENQKRIYFYINQWINGNNPPPRCKAFINELQCFEEASNYSPYCNFLHNCHSSLINCTSQRKNQQTLFCEQHVCSLNQCISEKFKETQFCSRHVCSGCLLSNSIEIKYRSPFACIDHQCKIDNCNKLQVYPFKGFCIDHVCTECLSNKQENHLARIENSEFCKKHKCILANCIRKCYNESINYCSYHICRICFANQILNGADFNCADSQLCEKHRCIELNCLKNKINSSSYCINHSCKECVKLNLSNINRSIHKAPRNSCNIHPLCNFVLKNGKQCEKIAKKLSSYCIDHQISINRNLDEKHACSGKTKKSENCKSAGKVKIGGNWYCFPHKDQGSTNDDTEQSESDDENEKENNNNKINLMPVSANQQTTNLKLKKIKCNGMFNDKEKCDIYIYSDLNQNAWFCPIHTQQVFYRKNEANKNEENTKMSEIKVELSSIDPNKKNVVESEIKNSSSSTIENVKNVSLIEEKKIPTKKGELIDDDDDDEIDFSEPLSHNINVDEIDEYFEDGEEQENDELKRLKELTELADYSDEEEREENEPLIDQNVESNAKKCNQNDLEYLIDVKSWSWNMSQQDRLIACAKLIRLASSLINRLNKVITKNDLYLARKNCAEAGAKLFRKARIIGSTVVGASRRLEALRSAEPFAIVIEEACEVIEPTLVSVLAVNTLRKLEMIGDHRQLPAFVQQCWFNFETTMPSIKTSLFERLITGQVKSISYREAKEKKAAGILPFTILDEQRRMRSSIADITRPDYDDIVQILDHRNTSIQCIGDVLIRNCLDDKQVKRLKENRQTWPDNGRSVPGLLKNIYFWDLLNNTESRPIAGLSACNQNEAETVASLTKWLILCGCPPASISIITPYKGQKTAITQALRKNNCLPPFVNNRPPPERGTTVTISTVDRYQGDENDIVILSLVRCNPGNRFVGLKNRFVVAMSRARLGFFVIGSVKAVVTNRNGSEGPSHWRRFVTSLTQIEENNNINESGCGNSLPICCPRHNDTKLDIKHINDFPNEASWKTFCSLECNTKLTRCGHLCKLPCHSPTHIPHNNKCNELLERPCETHSLVPVSCHEVVIEKNEQLIDALKKFECKIKIDYCRPECGHMVKIKCFEKELLNLNLMKLDDCKEIVSDYIHPVCNHRFERPKCVDKRKYEIKEPKCNTRVNHIHKCKCMSIMECHESIKQSINPSICNKSVEIKRPRCGHILSMRCNQAEKLKIAWEDQQGIPAINEPNREAFVYYGENYGPAESLIDQKIPQCKVPVTYKMCCGHLLKNVQCSLAFEYSVGLNEEPECKNIVSFQCFICQSKLSNECWLSNYLKSFNIWENETILSKNLNGDLSIDEANLEKVNIIPDISAKIEKILPKLCNSIIHVNRSCTSKHITLINCYQLFQILTNKKKLLPCDSPIERTLPCKHNIIVSCSERSKEPPPLCREKINESYTYSCELHTIKVDKCCDLSYLKSTKPECKNLITCTRFRCGHQIELACNLKKLAEKFSPGNVIKNGEPAVVMSNVQYCEEEREIESCKKNVSYRYELCGHLRNAKCFEAFLWASDNEKQPKCQEIIDFINPVCDHLNKAKCNEVDLLKDLMRTNQWNPWMNQNKPKCIEFVINHDEDNKPIHGYSLKEETLNIKLQAPVEISKQLFKCDIIFELIRKCGHTSVITCSNVYWKTYASCEDVVTIECEKPDCKHKKDLLCHVYESEKRAGKKYLCKNKVLRTCKKCNINKVEVECSQVVIECNSKVTDVLSCKHEIVWSCGRDEDPRNNPSLSCQTCIFNKWEKIIEIDVANETNNDLLDKIMRKIHQSFGEYATIDKMQKIAMPKDGFIIHNNCRKDIVDRYLINNLSNDIKIDINFPKSESLADLSYYDLTFLQVDKNYRINGDETFYFDLKGTIYGTGIELMQLNEHGLNCCKSDENGLIHVLIGASFRFNISPFSKPFCPDLNKKGLKMANKTSNGRKQAGYDCIYASPDDSKAKKVVYWEPGSSFKLALVSLKIHEMCKICLDFFPKKNGYLCSKRHFLCWDCFEQHVTQASMPGSVGKTIDNEGNLLCPECDEIIALLTVAKESVPPKVFDLLNELKSSLKIKKAVERALKDQEDRLKKEFDKIMAIQDEEERNAERLRLDIIENILTLRCPRCKCAFIDYEGCAALTCGVCKAGFCAYCLRDCGNDAHAHVPTCGNMYLNPNEFNKLHSKRRENLVKEKLKNQSEKVKNLIYIKMNKEFSDLGIQIQFQNQNQNQKSKGIFGFF